MASPPVAPAKVDYPSSDGRPMAESDFQRTPLIYAVDRLRQHFRSRRDVYVSGNLLLYYQEGNPRAVVAPDVFVVLGVSNTDRSSYLLWTRGPRRNSRRDTQSASTSRSPASTSARFRGLSVPDCSISRARSMQVNWDTTTTESLDNSDSAASRYTLPGASASLGLVVNGTHSTEPIRLRLKLSA